MFGEIKYLRLFFAVILSLNHAASQESGSELRLPRSVLPIHYDVQLLPIIEEGNFTTPGSVSILVQCTEPTWNVTLHSAEIIVDQASVRVSDIESNEDLIISSVQEDPVKEFLVISLSNRPLEVGKNYTVLMKFTSILNEDLRGLYRSSYVENGEKKYLAVTQMQPTDARRAFPCFDEPNMKASFAITLGRKESMTSASNMPIEETIPIDGMPGYLWDRYETSLPMSTYLVGMLVSEFNALESPEGLSETRFRIWTRPDAANQAAYASLIGPQVLEFYENYFQIAFPLPKQDMVAVPDFALGGMENWGLITYRETALLYDPVVSSASNKQRVASIVAHELAHQWFGDLVTMDWWSDLWLNEGFASYIEYIGSSYVEPNMEIADQIVTDELQEAFAVDSLETSHPISVNVNNPAEINEIFDSITYSKGASIIRMLASFLGEETFRKGLTNYLNTRKYSNAVQDDLWSALTDQAAVDGVSLPTDVKTIMDTWTRKMGYPLVNVSRNYETGSALVSQERFLLSSSGNSSDSTVYQWWVPLTYTSDFGSPPKAEWISKDQESKELAIESTPDQWIIVNVDEVGYYRVSYDTRNWQLIADQLLADHTRIGQINRAQIMDDSLNIARANLLSYPIALDLTQYLRSERDYLPWKSALNALSYIDLMFEKSPGYGNLKHYLTGLVTPFYEYVQFVESESDAHVLILNRGIALKWACKLGISDCVTNSQKAYNNWMSDPENPRAVSPNQKRVIACTAIENGSESEWSFAYDRYLATNVAAEKDTLLYAMSCSREIWILSRMLEWSLDPSSGIRRQDASTLFRNVAANPLGRFLAFDFLRNRWSEMVNYYPSLFDLARLVDSVASGFNTQLEVDELKQFRDEHQNELGSATRSVDQSIERAEANTKWMELHYQEIVDWLQNH